GVAPAALTAVGAGAAGRATTGAWTAARWLQVAAMSSSTSATPRHTLVPPWGRIGRRFQAGRASTPPYCLPVPPARPERPRAVMDPAPRTWRATVTVLSTCGAACGAGICPYPISLVVWQQTASGAGACLLCQHTPAPNGADWQIGGWRYRHLARPSRAAHGLKIEKPDRWSDSCREPPLAPR